MWFKEGTLIILLLCFFSSLKSSEVSLPRCLGFSRNIPLLKGPGYTLNFKKSKQITEKSFFIFPHSILKHGRQRGKHISQNGFSNRQTTKSAVHDLFVDFPFPADQLLFFSPPFFHQGNNIFDVFPFPSLFSYTSLLFISTLSFIGISNYMSPSITNHAFTHDEIFMPFSLLYSYVDPSLIFDLIERNAFDIIVTLKDATATSDFANLIAVAVAESSSGIVGGALSGALVKAVGNEKKQDAIQTRLSTSGIFFGIRGTIRATVRLLGIPYPIGLVLATLIGSTISQTVKILADQERQKLLRQQMQSQLQSNSQILLKNTLQEQKILENQDTIPKKTSGEGIENSSNRILDTLILFEKMDQNVASNPTSSKSSIATIPGRLSGAEITGDILKWILFDYLTNQFQEYLFVPPKTEFLFYFFIGAVAGGLGKGVEEIISSTAYLLIPQGKENDRKSTIQLHEGKETVDNRREDSFANEKSVFQNILVSIMESGVLFSSYRLSVYLFNSVIPEDLNKQLYFELLYRKFIENYFP